MSDLVGTPEDRFSHVAAHFKSNLCPGQKDTGHFFHRTRHFKEI